MKNIIIITILVLNTSIGKSQQTSGQGSPVSFGPYIGYPNNANYFLYKSYEGNLNVQNYKTIGTPISIGFRGESIQQKRVGIMMDANYEISGYRYDYKDSNQVGLNNLYSVYYSSSKLRILLRFNYYLIDESWIKIYTGIGAGYRYVSRQTKSTNPNFVNSTTENTIPFTGRIAFGIRIFPIQKLGLFLEAGIFGGSLLQGGITFTI